MPVRLSTLRAIASDPLPVRIAIFGVPVVPDVPISSDTASGSAAAGFARDLAGSASALGLALEVRGGGRAGERFLDLRRGRVGWELEEHRAGRVDREREHDVVDRVAICTATTRARGGRLRRERRGAVTRARRT